jgi:hypothetical protein
MSSLSKKFSHLLRWSLMIAVLLFATGPQVSKAGIIIDGFNPTSPFIVPLPGSGSDSTGTVLGGVRDYFGSKSGPLNATIVAIGGFGALSTDSFTTSTATMQYDGNAGRVVNVNGLGGFDLTQAGLNNQFQLTVGVDLAGYQATMAVWSGGNLFTSSFIVPQGSPTNVFVPFASFGGANFASIGAIELRLNTGATPVAEADFVIRGFSAVPEPSSLLLVLGFGSACLYRRRRLR